MSIPRFDECRAEMRNSLTNRPPDRARNTGYVYFIGMAQFPGVYKIGSTISIKRRIQALAAGTPFTLEVALALGLDYSDHSELEYIVHKGLWSKRVRNEWYELSDEDFMSVFNLVMIEKPFVKPVCILGMAAGYYAEILDHFREALYPIGYGDL